MPPAPNPEWLGTLPGALLTAIALTRAADGLVLYANAALADLLGVPEDEIVGRPLEALLSSRADLDVDARTRELRTSDGGEVLLTELHDASASREVAQQLADLARFPDMNPGPVLRLDREGTILLANLAARRLLGADPAGASWLTTAEGVDPQAWAHLVEDGTGMQHETSIGDACFTFTYVPSPSEGFVFAFGTDITARRAAEEELAELARFPDMNPGPVLRLDLQGTVLLANRAASELFGEELLGQSWLDLFSASRERWSEIAEAFDPVRLEARFGDRDFVFAHRGDRRSGLVFVYGTDITMQRRAEEALRQSERMATLGTLAAGVAHELNNPAAATRRAAEQLRDALARLEDAYHMLDAAGLDAAARELVRVLEHEARAAATRRSELEVMARADLEADVEDWLTAREIAEPWALAQALVDQGLDIERLGRLAGALSGEALRATLTWAGAAFPVYRLAHEIGQGSARISEIVGAMKGYSYLGQAPEQVVDVHESLDNTLVILHHKLDERVEVRRDYDADLPRIPAYGSELSQVWTNLLDNALDAVGGAGRISIRTASEDGWVVVRIEDDGPGIPGEVLPRVFDRFFTTKEPGQGTGLGLSTTYAIVTENHRGEISVASRPGSTCFTVRLPLERPRVP